MKLTDIFFLEFARQVTLDKSGFADTTVADQNKLKDCIRGKYNIS